MPNRILKESICTSDSIDGLGWFEEVLFYRLIVNCDDYGRFDGRPAIIKNRLFPLKETLTVKAVTGAINKLASAGLVTLYMFEGKPYLYLPTWNYHQTVRAKRSKYPAPEDGCESMNTSEIICNQMNANDPVIQSNPNPIRNPNTDAICADAGELPAPPAPEKAPNEERHQYGEYKNVLLSGEDLEKLKSEFPDTYQDYIERLSGYIASTGKKYKSHLATIRNWAREDKGKTSKKPSGLPDGKFQPGETERASISALARYREQLREG